MIRRAIINLIFRLLDTFLIAKISYDPLREYVDSQLDPLRLVTDALTDKDPENAEQLKQIWFENNEEFTRQTALALRKTIELSIEDEERKQVLIEFLTILEDELLDAFEGPNK